jgi:hypothetical protein
MYSGTTFRTKSGRMMGVHQKIDRIAYRRVRSLLPSDHPFPLRSQILHFEGLNGPDGIKRKSPGKDEPWHYIDPANPEDHLLVDMINDHIVNMATALRNNNPERAAFEAAWMAHAITDGLTPAHHYPLEEKLEELRGEGIETRNSAKDKLLIPGKNRRAQLRNNWEFWGAKGVMTTHLAFELGVATTITPQRFKAGPLSNEEVQLLDDEGFEAVFRKSVHEISSLKMYEEFSRLGWTRHLARETISTLIPIIARTVALGWYDAARTAENTKK